MTVNNEIRALKVLWDLRFSQQWL